jgi:hypothetical protein
MILFCPTCRSQLNESKEVNSCLAVQAPWSRPLRAIYFGRKVDVSMCRRFLPFSGIAFLVAGLAQLVVAPAAPCTQDGGGQQPSIAERAVSLPAGAIARLGTSQEPEKRLSALYVTFLPDGSTVATSGPVGKLRFFDVRTAKEIRWLDTDPYVLIAPDGRTFASRRIGTSGWLPDSAPRLWNLKDNKEIGPPAGGRGVGGSRTLSFSFDGRFLAVGGGSEKSRADDPPLCILDAATGKQVREFPLRRMLNAITFSPDGGVLATAKSDNHLPVIQTWDVATGQQRPGFKIQADDTTFLALRISPDGALLAGASNQPCAWDLSTGTKRWHLYRVDDVAGDDTYDLAFSPNGQMVALGTSKGKIVLVESATGRQRARFRDTSPFIWSLAFSPCGRMVASLSHDCAPLIWDVTGLIKRKTEPAQLLGPKALDEYWDQLRHDDAARAWQAIVALAARPEQAAGVLLDRLGQRKSKLAAKQLAQLLASRDADDFDLREQASTELANLGPEVVPALEKVRAKPPSVEAKRRAEDLLVAIAKSGLVSEDLLRRRVLETLEYVGTPAAKEVVHTEAQAQPSSPLSQAAKAALTRLAKRPAWH